MRTSQRGLKLIAKREGVILHVYLDSKDLPTAGVGHLLTAAERRQFPVGTVISQSQSDEWLTADLKKAEDAVNSLGVDLEQNEFDALVSLTFNIGVGSARPRSGFLGSTVARDLKAGDKDAAAKAILLWDKPPEIRGRRRGEYVQFKTAYPATAPADNPQSPATDSDKGDVNGSNIDDTPPPNNVVVEKEEHPTFTQYIWKKLTGAVAAIGGTSEATSFAQQAQVFGLTPQFWATVFTAVAIGVSFWIVCEAINWFVIGYLRRKRTEKIAALNSTPTNAVNIVPTDQLYKYENDPKWTVIRRNQ